jgi:transcriptional regulator with XRE-family HTH domain
MADKNRPFLRELGAWLRAERMSRGWSLQETAAMIPWKMPHTTLRSYEAGTREMSARTFQALAGFWGVPVDDLIPIEIPE